jgi:hypothetical protein
VIALAIAYSKSRYLSWFRWLCTLIGSLGISLSAHSIFRNDVVTATVFLAALVAFALALNIENVFHHPQRLRFFSEPGCECQIDNRRGELKAVWACPWFVVLNLKVECAPASALNGLHDLRVLLGKDVLADQDWHGLALWRVWRQRN